MHQPYEGKEHTSDDLSEFYMKGTKCKLVIGLENQMIKIKDSTLGSTAILRAILCVKVSLINVLEG